MDRRRQIRRHLDRPVRRGHPDHVALADAELARALGVDLDPGVPDRLGHRVGHFLEPAAAGAAAVVEAERGIRQQGEAVTTVELGGGGIDALDPRRHAGRRHVAPGPALAQRGVPLAGLDHRVPRRLQVLLDRAPRQRPLALLAAERGAAHGQQHVAHRAGIADRLHRRLQEPDDALLRRVVAPRLEPVRVGQDEVRERGRLVGQRGEADDEGDLANGVGDLEPARQREGRVDAAAEDEQRDLAGRHRLHEPGHLGVRRHLAVGVIRTEPHRLAEIAGRRVEQVDRDLQLGGVTAGDRDPAADGQARPGAGERAGDLLERLERHAAVLGDLLRIHRRRRVGEAAVGAALFDHELEDRQRHRGLGAGRVAHPFVGVGGGQRLTGLDVDEPAGLAVAERVHARESARVANVRHPGLEEVGAERENDLGVLEGVVGHGVAAERGPVGGADRLVGERLQRDPRSPAQGLGPAVEEAAEAAALELGHDGQGLALALHAAELLG